MALSLEAPFPTLLLPSAFRWAAEIRHRFDDDDVPRDEQEWCLGMRARLRGPGVVSWAVYRDAELGGCIMVVPGPASIAELHILFKRSFWGQKTAEEAVRMAIRQLFAAGCPKLETTCFSDNGAVIALARRLGGQIEATLRRRGRRNGKPEDLKIIGLLPEEFEPKAEVSANVVQRIA